MENKYCYLLFWYLYKCFNLCKFDEKLKEINVVPINNKVNITERQQICLEVSKYFYLINDIDVKKLNEEEKKYLNEFSIEKINDLSKEELQELNKFINDTLFKCLFSNIKDKYLYYGPVDFKYAAPGDAIAFGFKYDEFGLDSGRKVSVEEHISMNNKVCDILNSMQDEINKKIKFAVIEYNEMSKNLGEIMR